MWENPFRKVPKSWEMPCSRFFFWENKKIKFEFKVPGHLQQLWRFEQALRHHESPRRLQPAVHRPGKKEWATSNYLLFFSFFLWNMCQIQVYVLQPFERKHSRFSFSETKLWLLCTLGGRGGKWREKETDEKKITSSKSLWLLYAGVTNDASTYQLTKWWWSSWEGRSWS